MELVHNELEETMSVYVPTFGQWFNLEGEDYNKGLKYMENHNISDEDLMRGLISGNINL